jgi:hypothetical protein
MDGILRKGLIVVNSFKKTRRSEPTPAYKLIAALTAGILILIIPAASG